MSVNVKRIEVRNAEGALLFSLHVIDEGQSGHVNNDSPSDQNRHHGSNGQTNSAMMSEAQKNYLLRILGEGGFQGDAAMARLKQVLGTDDLAMVSKQDASATIKQLLDEAAATK